MGTMGDLGYPGIDVVSSDETRKGVRLPRRPALWLRHADPFVAAAEKKLSHAEKQRVWSRSCDLQELLQYIYIH